MQYGINRFLLILIVYLVLHVQLSLLRKNAAEAEKSSKQTQNKQISSSFSMRNNSKPNSKSLNKTVFKSGNWSKWEYINCPNSIRNVEKLYYINNIKDKVQTNEETVKHESSTEDDCDDVIVLRVNTEEPLMYKQMNKLHHYELEIKRNRYISQLLDEIDSLIDKFNKVSRGFDIRHRNIHRTQSGRFNKDVVSLEHATRNGWKTRPSELTNQWTEWSQWSPCSVTCGQGVSKRNRRKFSPNFPAQIEELQEKKCIMPDCPPFGLVNFFSKIFSNVSKVF